MTVTKEHIRELKKLRDNVAEQFRHPPCKRHCIFWNPLGHYCSRELGEDCLFADTIFAEVLSNLRMPGELLTHQLADELLPFIGAHGIAKDQIEAFPTIGEVLETIQHEKPSCLF